MLNYCLCIEQTHSDILKEIKYKHAVKINNSFCSSWNHRYRGHIARPSTWGRAIANTRSCQLWLCLAKSWKISKDETPWTLWEICSRTSQFSQWKSFSWYQTWTSLNCSLKPLALIKLGATKKSIFFYQQQYNLPVVFIQCHLWQSAPQEKNACFSFWEGPGSRMSWGEVRGFNM